MPQVSEQSSLRDLSCKHLFNASEDGLIVLTKDFQILEINQSAKDLLGIEEGIPAQISKFLSLQKVELSQLWHKPLSHFWMRNQFSFEFSSKPLTDAGGQAQGVLIRLKNLATQKLYEQHINEAQWRYNKLLALSERRSDEIALLHSVRDALNSANDRSSICQIVVERSSDLYGYNLLSIYLIENNHLILQHQVGYKSYIESLSLEKGVMGKVARTGQAALINSDHTDPDLVWAFEGIQSEVCVPIEVNQQVIGVFNIESLDGYLAESDLSLAKTLAGYVGEAFRRIKLLETLQEREKSYRDLVENADDIIYTISLAGYFIYANPTTEKLTGYSQEKLKQIHFLELIRPDYQAASRNHYEEQFKKRLDSSHFVFPMMSAQGEEHWLSQKVRLIWNEGRIQYMQAFSRDITEQVKTEQALANHTKALERANRDLQKFSFITAHDLQEPLRKMRTFSDRLSKKYNAQFDDQGKLYLNRLSQAAQRMQHLIGDIQLFSFIGTELKESEVDLNLLLKTWEKQNISLIEEADAHISYPDLPVLNADAHHLRLLFGHLLTNALKFRRANVPVKIELNFCDLSDWLEFSITDNGSGFDATYSEKIFEVFQTLHCDKETLGNGMGLALCRKIVDTYGGSISATTQKGAGSTFSLRLPSSMKLSMPQDAERFSQS